MKVNSYRLASGRLELRVQDSHGGHVTMRFDDTRQMRVLAECIALEADKQRRHERSPSDGTQLSLF